MDIDAAARRGGPSRRAILTAAGAAAALPGLPAWARAAAGPRQVAGFVPKRSPDVGHLQAWLNQLHDFGPIRFTGTPPCRAFEEWLAKQMSGLHFQVERDQHRLTAWECDLQRDCSLTLRQPGRPPHELDVVAYYPFAASTRDLSPVTGRVLYAGIGDAAVKALVATTDPALLARSIVVVDMPLKGGGAREIPEFQPKTFPEALPAAYAGPNPATQGGRPSMEAVEGKVKALVLCYVDVSDEAARYNWLPFSDIHRKTPALWTGRAGSEMLRSVSGKASVSLTLRCEATLTPDARADTLVATLPGQSTDEVVFLTIQTDGPNECNENGALGLLALATYAARTPLKERRRTLVVSLPTGHYAMGAVLDPVTGSGRPPGTRGVLEKRPELVKKIVGQIALEQMGATEWSAADMGWKATGDPAPEFWIPTPATRAASTALFHAATRGEDSHRSRSFVVEKGAAPGEGGAPRALGIPGIGLMGAPQYFFRADPKGVIDKLDPKLMKTQVDIATKMMLLMDRLTVDQLNGSAPVSEAELFG